MPSKTIYFAPQIMAALPRHLYLDANILISNHLPQHKWYRRAKALLAELMARKSGLYVSTLALDEAWWKLLVEFYERDHGPGSWRPQVVRQDPALLRRYEPELRRFTTALLALPRLHVTDQVNGQALVTSALDHVRDHALAPRDAFHLALLQSQDVALAQQGDQAQLDDLLLADDDAGDVGGDAVRRFLDVHFPLPLPLPQGRGVGPHTHQAKFMSTTFVIAKERASFASD